MDFITRVFRADRFSRERGYSNLRPLRHVSSLTLVGKRQKQAVHIFLQSFHRKWEDSRSEKEKEMETADGLLRQLTREL
ncbi:hypothetical protein RUM43_008162 [Polyplax serrata]|uniref:Uncharacterized protein n=1 Tax=Polyplax serrata TaxID=468196 RepID=A0AAN8S897_POLSC